MVSDYSVPKWFKKALETLPHYDSSRWDETSFGQKKIILRSGAFLYIPGVSHLGTRGFKTSFSAFSSMWVGVPKCDLFIFLNRTIL